VDLAVYDVQGRRLVALVDDARSAGIHRVAWDGTTASGRVAPGGVYFVRLVTDGGTETRRVVRMR
jgi:flagellar hook assembly protein FlgD